MRANDIEVPSVYPFKNRLDAEMSIVQTCLPPKTALIKRSVEKMQCRLVPDPGSGRAMY